MATLLFLDLNENFQPNHFVPLVEFIAKQGSKLKTIQQKKITELLKPEGANKDNVARKVTMYIYTRVYSNLTARLIQLRHSKTINR